MGMLGPSGRDWKVSVARGSKVFMFSQEER